MSDTTPPRAAASGVTATFLDLVSFSVDLMPAIRSSGSGGSAPSFKLVCPTCTSGTAVHQQYNCPENHGPFAPDEVVRALADGETLTKVSQQFVEKAKEPVLPAGQANFGVYPADQVEAATLPGGSTYRLRPHVEKKHKLPAVTAQSYAMVLDLVSDRAYAFICELTMRGSTKMYRVINRDNILTLVELIRPSELRDAFEVPNECDERLLVRGRDLMQQVVTDFNPAEWEDRRHKRVEELTEALAKGEDLITEAPAPTSSAADSLLSLLEASVAAVKATEPAPKPKRTRRTKATTTKAA